MNVYKTYTLAEARQSEGYDARMTEELLQNASGKYYRVDFVIRNDGHRLPRPEPGVIQYIKATGGKWGKSSQTRQGKALICDPLISAIACPESPENMIGGDK